MVLGTIATQSPSDDPISLLNRCIQMLFEGKFDGMD